ncbi:MAG: PAS domain S-box protein [Gallionella sp.]|nr:PAS domain S-box protein [Gallionella sp.]
MDKPTGQTELRILLLEDMPTDAELVEDALREAGLSFTAKRVDTRDAFIRALEEFKPDIVLADYRLPAFDGGSAVKIARQQHPNIPVVMVTGAIGDETAVELLRLGARDYVLKDRLARLGSAVRRALSEEQGIQARKLAEEALRHSEADIRALVEHSPIAMLVDIGVDADEKIVMMNEEFTELFGYTMEDVPDVHHWWPLAYPDEKYREEIRVEWTGRVEQAIQSHGHIEPMEATVTCKDGSNRYVKISLASIGSRNIITFEDLTEHRRLEDALKEASDRSRVIMETANDAIICIKPDGIIQLWNHKAEELFGYTAGEAVGHELHQLIVPERYREKALEGLRQFAKTGTGYVVGQTRELTAWHKGRVEFPIELSISSMNIRGEWHATGIIRDITERKQAEARVQKLTRLYATLSETNHTIVRTTNREELFARICENVVTHGKFVLAWVGLVDEATRMVKPVCHHGAEAGYLTNIIISTDDVPAGRGPTGTAIRDNCVSYVNDYATDERTLPWREAALKRGFCGAAGVPLRFNNKVIGALTLYTDELNFFDAEQLGLLEEMAMDIGFTLDNFAREAERKQAENQLAEQLDELRRWHDATLGREMRVLELKKEVNELLEQAGQPPRYRSAEEL